MSVNQTKSEVLKDFPSWVARALVAFALLLATTPSAAESNITLDDAFRAALEKTESLSVGQSRVEQADSRVEQSRAKFRPSLSAGYEYQRQDTTWGSDPHSDQVSTKLSVAQSIFEGGKDSAALEARKLERASESLKLGSIKQSLFLDVAKAFYAILTAEAEQQNIKKIIILAEDRIGEMQKRMAIGRSRHIEVLAARAQLSVLKSQLLSAEGQLNSARDHFALVTGLIREASLVAPTGTVAKPDDLETLLKKAEEHPEIAELRARAEAARSNVKSIQAGHMPSIDLAGNYYLSRTGYQKDTRWDLTIGLTLPIYSGGLTDAQVREAKAKETEAELLLRQKRREIQTGIRTAYGELASALDQIASLEQAQTLTEQNYHEQVKDYRYSLATNIDVLQALNSYQESKRALDRTRYQAWTAAAALKAASAQAQ